MLSKAERKLIEKLYVSGPVTVDKLCTSTLRRAFHKGMITYNRRTERYAVSKLGRDIIHPPKMKICDDCYRVQPAYQRKCVDCGGFNLEKTE